MATNSIPIDPPLKDMDEWDDFLTGRYKEGKSGTSFVSMTRRQPLAWRSSIGSTISTRRSTTLWRRRRSIGPDKGMKSIWEAAEFLNTLVDDSDPDTDLTQIEHLLQTSEAIRKDGHPRWFVLTEPHPRSREGSAALGRAPVGRGYCRFRSDARIRRTSYFPSTSKRIRHQ